jgi:L-fuculose-phosphate aldolase
MMTEKEIRQALKDAGIRLLEKGLTQGTWGNLSIRLDERHMVVTPSGLDYTRLTPDDMVVVDIETLEYYSHIKPTSEKKIHAAIYRERKDINAVIHSHPLNSSSVAAARKSLPVMSEEMRRLVGGEARLARYGLPSTDSLTKSTIKALEGRNACLQANHGLVVCAGSMDEAFEVCRVMEESARLYIESEVKKILKKDDIVAEDIIEAFCNIINK